MDHERGFCGSEGGGSDDEVAFIFTVRTVEYKNELAGSYEKNEVRRMVKGSRIAQRKNY